MFDPMAPIRADVMAQPEAIRAEYALDVLAYYLDPRPEFYGRALAAGLKLSARELRAFYCLWVARGRVVSENRVLAAMCLGLHPDDWPVPEQIRKPIAAIRRQIESVGLPLTLRRISGEGYILTAPAGFEIGGADDA
jgi:DNA-binding response OmpR family regulator